MLAGKQLGFQPFRFARIAHVLRAPAHSSCIWAIAVVSVPQMPKPRYRLAVVPSHPISIPQSSSIIPPPRAPPSSLLRTLPLLHLPPPRSLGLRQSFNPLRLPRLRLIRNSVLTQFLNQSVQSAETGRGIIGLLARVVGLDYQGGVLGRMVA